MDRPVVLSRRSLSIVLQSLLGTELLAARGRADPDARLPAHLPGAWPEELRIGGGLKDGLGCDSLETLWLASAANEMFHLHEADDADGLLQDVTFGGWINRIEAGWRSGIASITFSTSGTTGRPKRCTHAVHTLHTEGSCLAELFQDRRRVVSLVPAHHAYGFLLTAILPDALNIDRLDATRLGPGKLSHILAPGDLVVGFPERWRWLERSLSAWPEDVDGVVSAAPCAPDLIAALHERGLSSMTEIYGSSETAGVAIRRWPQTSYRLMPHWHFAEPINEAAPEIAHRSGWHIGLPDGIRSRDGDCFELSDRLDGAVQVGGINVFPERVAARLRERPGVREATTRLMRPEEGSRLKVFVVPETGVDPTELLADLRTWIDAGLTVAERPTAIVFGTRLPVGHTGKAADW